MIRSSKLCPSERRNRAFQMCESDVRRDVSISSRRETLRDCVLGQQARKNVSWGFRVGRKTGSSAVLLALLYLLSLDDNSSQWRRWGSDSARTKRPSG